MRRRESGQATVELALILPVVILVFLAALQLVSYSRHHVLVVNAARAAARTAMTTGDIEAIGLAGRAASPDLRPDRLRFEVEGERIAGKIVKVRVRYSYGIKVPLIGELLRDKTEIAATVAMVVEVP